MIDTNHILAPLGPLGLNGTGKPNSLHQPELDRQDDIQKTAREFETAFIAQMLQFSGLAKALTTGGGKSVESFTQFYLEELAKDITNNGGFGIADKIASYMRAKEESHGELGRL
ncbi:MAG: hypothetical protein COA91_09360 [Robiginitomaculum sp.]|nr:MAG: hypothetical protein COA91_09360 [Robiginitomaculum sp.]